MRMYLKKIKMKQLNYIFVLFSFMPINWCMQFIAKRLIMTFLNQKCIRIPSFSTSARIIMRNLQR